MDRIAHPLLHFSNFQCSKAQSAFRVAAGSRGAWFDRLTTPRKIEGKEVPEALHNMEGECAIVIFSKTGMLKETYGTTLSDVELCCALRSRFGATHPKW